MNEDWQIQDSLNTYDLQLKLGRVALMRKEVIGDCVSCLDAPFFLHMARLAKSNQIASFVRSFNIVKLAKRFDVMYGKRFANMLFAFIAEPSLLRDHKRPNFEPPFAPISCNPPNVRGRFFGNKNAGQFKTCSAAKSSISILPGKPWLLIERFFTMFANQFNSIFPAWTFIPQKAFLKCVGWTFPDPKFIPHKVKFWPNIQRFPSPESPSTFEGTELGFCGSIWLYVICGPTLLANKIYCHFLYIAYICFGSMGVRTSEIAPPAKQEAFEL